MSCGPAARSFWLDTIQPSHDLFRVNRWFSCPFYGLPYQMGLLAARDPKGRAALAGTMMSTAGMAAGPAIAALLLIGRAHWPIGVFAGICYLCALTIALPAARSVSRNSRHSRLPKRPDRAEICIKVDGRLNKHGSFDESSGEFDSSNVAWHDLETFPIRYFLFAVRGFTLKTPRASFRSKRTT